MTYITKKGKLALLKFFGIKQVGNSYHDIIVYVNGKKYDIFNLPYTYELAMNRIGGWSLWHKSGGVGRSVLIGGEYNNDDFRIEVNGFIICKSKKKP